MASNYFSASKNMITFIGALLMCNVSFAAISYDFSASSGAYTANAGTNIWTTNADDNLSAAINIGFTFNFGGCTSTAYTQVKVSTNGWMALGTAATGSQSSNAMSWSTYGPLLAPFWDDLKTGGTAASVNYLTSGVAGSRVFTVEWLKMKCSWSAGSESISFQVKLYEANGKIEFIYRQEAGTLSSPSVSIGINGGGATDFYSLNSTSTNPGVSYGTATNNINSRPATGQIYIWLPSTPMTYTASSVFQASTANVYNGTNNQEVLGIKIDVAGGCSPFSLTQLVLNMTGTTLISDVTNIDVYYTGNASSFSASVYYGSAAPATGSLTVNGSQQLLSGSNYFWIVYDISPTATLGDFVDAQCTQITCGGGVGAKSPTGNPAAGSREIVDAPPSFMKWIEKGWAKDVIETSDGNLLWVGMTSNTYSSGNSDAYFVKTTPDLSVILWTAVIGTAASFDRLETVVETSDGFVGIGSSNIASGHGSYDIFVTKVNLSGTHQWSKTLGQSSTDYGYGICKTSDGNVAVVGYVYDVTGVSNDGYFAKIQNSNGNILFEKQYSPSGSSAQFQDVVQTTDGGFLIGGRYNSDFYVVKLTAAYAVDWDRYWGGINTDEINFVMENAANDYTIGGYTYSYGAGGADGYAMRFTWSGGVPTVTWVKSYGTSDGDSFKDGAKTADGGFAASGVTVRSTDPLDNEAWVAKINAVGNIDFIRSIGTTDPTEDQEAWGITSSTSGNYYLCGLNNNASGTQFFMMQVASTGYNCSNIQDIGTVTVLAAPALTSGSITLINIASDQSQTPVLNVGGEIANGGCITLPAVVLPIELLAFDGICDDQGNVLFWSTASEANSDYFTLEKSMDGTAWETVAKVNAKGNSSEISRYQITDSKPTAGASYYRLRQTDLNGNFNYSQISVVDCAVSDRNPFSLFPNPAGNLFWVQYTLQNGHDPIRVEITAINGDQVAYVFSEDHSPTGYLEVDVEQLSAGVYFAKITCGTKQMIQKLMIVD